VAADDAAAAPQPQLLGSPARQQVREPRLGFGVLLLMLPRKDGLEAGRRRLAQEGELCPSSRQDTSVPGPRRLPGAFSFASLHNHLGKHLSSTGENSSERGRFTSAAGSARSVPRLLPVARPYSPWSSLVNKPCPYQTALKPYE